MTAVAQGRMPLVFKQWFSGGPYVARLEVKAGNFSQRPDPTGEASTPSFLKKLKGIWFSFQKRNFNNHVKPHVAARVERDKK